MGSFVVFILCIYCLYVCPTIISVNFCYGVCSIYTTIYFFLMRDKNINLQDSNQQLVVQSVADPKSSQQLPTTINICTNTCENFKLYECFTVIYFNNYTVPNHMLFSYQYKANRDQFFVEHK